MQLPQVCTGLLKSIGIAAMAAILFANAAAAHSSADQSGFVSGLTHPVFGIDHLLAMFAVGLWGAQLGGRLVWELPVAFPLVMSIGGVLGILGTPIPYAEVIIALSMIVLGLAIAAAWRPNHWLAIVLVGAFALFHGHAHGVELPGSANPIAYAAGFVLATGLIHVAGIGFGLAVGKLWDGKVSRAAGAAIACAGAYFLLA
jgi:urease accessory protein